MRKQKNIIPQPFKEDDIKRLIKYELKLLDKMKDSFDFVFDKLVIEKYHKKMTPKTKVNFDKLKFDEGKNYNWFAITYGDVQLIIRAYGQHQTVYTRLTEHHVFENSKRENSKWETYTYSCFTFETKLEGLSDSEHDGYIDNPFIEFDKVFHKAVGLVADNNIFNLDNNLVIPRPEYCKFERAFYSEEICGLDLLAFCAEELMQKHLTFYAENEMVDILKELIEGNAVGKQLDKQKKVTRINTVFPERYSNPYYHAIGIDTIDNRGQDSFQDVYSLTRFYMDDVLKLKLAINE